MMLGGLRSLQATHVFHRLRSCAARMASNASTAEKFALDQYSKNFLKKKVKFTQKMKFIDPATVPAIPIYRISDTEGNILDEEQDPKFDKKTSVKIYKDLLKLNTMDTYLYSCQRQGRISFYMTSYGEEAIQIGCAVALEAQDLVFAQYREQGILMHRGYTVQQFTDACYGNHRDTSTGKQMPMCYGSTDYNVVTISPPLTVQLPQAVGAAYAFKRQANNDRITIVYFGEGAASEGDAHAAFNFAATLECPIVFFCRNNGYAISTHTSEQYAGDGIAGHGIGYGMHTIRIDGNDLFAVYNATKEARRIALEENKAVLVEAMTYRRGHHSTSDDSSAYRPQVEIDSWEKNDNPITRFRRYMDKNGWWSDEEEKKWVDKCRKEVLEAVSKSEASELPPVGELFDDVYDKYPQKLTRQRKELNDHIKEYGEHYPADKFLKERK